MNEEIVFGMGLDASGFHNGVTRVRSLMKDLKSEAKDLGRDILSGLGVAFGISELVKGGREIMEFAEHIKSTAENIGTSTDFLQQFNNAARHTGQSAESAQGGLEKLSKIIGEAREGTQDAIDKFTRWNIALNNTDGTARSVEQIVTAVSKRMDDIQDPTQRAAMATDLLGKSAIGLVSALRELEKYKGEAIISKQDLDTLDAANKATDLLMQKLKVMGAQTMIGLGLMAHPLETRRAIARMQEEANKLKHGEWTKEASAAEAERERKAIWGDKAGFQPVDPAKARAMAKAIEELNKAQQAGLAAGLSTQDRVNELTRQDLMLKRDIEEAQDGTLEKVKLQTQEQELQNKLAEEKKKLAEENQRKLEEEKRLTDEITDARERLRFSVQDRHDQVYDALKPTIEQVAATGYWYQHGHGNRPRWMRGPYAQTALDIENLEGRARDAYAYGNEALGNQLTDRRNALRSHLEQHGVISNDRHIERMDENIAKQGKHLEILSRTVQGGKIKIIPEMG